MTDRVRIGMNLILVTFCLEFICLEINRKTPPPGSNRLSPETMASLITDGDSTPVK